MRITEKDLKAVVDRINKTTMGNYRLDAAYGGWKLIKKLNTGGFEEVTKSGFTTKRELYNEMQAFLAGIEATKEY